MKKYASIFVSALCMACVLLAVPTSVQVPQEIKPFIKADTTVLDVKSADLNGDGTQDYVLAVEHNLTNSESQEPIRTVVILEREKSGVLKIAAKSDHAILCKGCGGVFGDPFESLEAKKMQFSIHHFGGSRIKWNCSYTFRYSSKDRAWELVQVDDGRWTESADVQTFLPPRDFGKIDFREFDSENWKDVGPK